MWKFLVPVILAVVFVVVEEVVTSREEASSCSYSTTKKAQDYSHKSLIFCWTWKVCVWENSQSVRKWALINQPWQSQPPGNGCSSINSNSRGLDACPLLLLALKMGRQQRPSCCGLWPLLDGKILCWWPSTLNWLMLTRVLCLIGFIGQSSEQRSIVLHVLRGVSHNITNAAILWVAVM